MAPKQGQNQGDNVRSFTLGNKELDGKTAEFQYDRGQYTITDVVGEERNVIYKSRNAQEAYTKWNVYIGRKKERPERPERQSDNASGDGRTGRGRNNRDEKREYGSRRNDNTNSRRSREDNRSERTSKRPERDNRSRSNNRRNSGWSSDSSTNGGYRQGFTATEEADSSFRDRGQRRPRNHRNNHKGQESSL
jgi:hypothetical protein